MAPFPIQVFGTPYLPRPDWEVIPPKTNIRRWLDLGNELLPERRMTHNRGLVLRANFGWLSNVLHDTRLDSLQLLLQLGPDFLPHLSTVFTS